MHLCVHVLFLGVIPTSVPSFVVENNAPPPPLAPPIVSLGEWSSDIAGNGR